MVVQALANVRHHRGIVVNFIAMIVYIFTSRNNKSVANCETIGESKRSTVGLRVFLFQHLTILNARHRLDQNSMACHYPDGL